MISQENGFNLNIRWRFPGGREYAYAFAALFVFLLVIYGNSFRGVWIFDDRPNIVENRNIALKSLDWPEIKKTFYGIEGKKIERPLAYLSFALNRYFGGLDVFGYHIVNFVIHYLTAVFLFLLLRNTLRLPILQERYGAASYSIALLASVLWATSPVQVTAVTYIVQRMASMAGLFYVAAMYLYLKGRTADRPWKQGLFWALCLLAAVLAFGTKENAVLLPFSIWLYDLLLIQGVNRDKVIRNLKAFVPVLLAVGAIAFWYVNIEAILSGAAYKNRPFTLPERLLTEPRVVIFYITLLFYPISSRLTFLHDIELSKDLLTPWTTLPAIVLVAALTLLAVYQARRRPLISFCVLFFFLNHAVESTFIPLELIYEHRNYIPSFFFFVPVAIAMVRVLDYFSYKIVIQLMAAALFSFLLFAQGHTVHERNALFAHPLLLWEDNVMKAPELSRPRANLGSAYWNLGQYEKAHSSLSLAEKLDFEADRRLRGINLYNIGMYHLQVSENYDMALKYFNSALKTYPGFWRSSIGAATCLIHKGDLTEAEKHLSSANTKRPGNSDLHYFLSLVLLKMGQYDRAIKEARLSLSLDPNQDHALPVLGEAYREKGHDNLSILYWESYKKKHPDVLEPYLALIELYARQNRQEKLSKTIVRFIALGGSTNLKGLFDPLLQKNFIAAHDPNIEKLNKIFKDRFCR